MEKKKFSTMKKKILKYLFSEILLCILITIIKSGVIEMLQMLATRIIHYLM